ANCGLCAPENRKPLPTSERMALSPPIGPALKATIPACELKALIHDLLETSLQNWPTVSFPQQVIGFLRREWLINAFMKGSRLLGRPFARPQTRPKRPQKVDGGLWASGKIIQPL